jgi:hypothetical protein
MSNVFMSFPLAGISAADRSTAIRVVCQNCHSAIEVAVDGLGLKGFESCPLCHNDWREPGTAAHPLVDFAKAINGLAAMKERLRVELMVLDPRQ